MKTVDVDNLIGFDVMPDWANGFTETRNYLTNVLQAYTEVEQRIRLRSIPRYTLDLEMSAVEIVEFQYMRNILWTFQMTDWAVPLWPDAVELEAAATAGDTTLTCDTEFSRFQELGGLMIWRGIRDYELRRIATVGTGVLNLSAPLANNWTLDDGPVWVMPFLVGNLPDRLDATVSGSKTDSRKVTFICEPTKLLEDGS